MICRLAKIAVFSFKETEKAVLVKKDLLFLHGNAEWVRYFDTIRRIKGEEIAEKIIDSFEENEVVMCDNCRTKFFYFLTGIQLFLPPDEDELIDELINDTEKE